VFNAVGVGNKKEKMMSRIWKVLLFALVTSTIAFVALAGSSVPSGDPYYKYVAFKNPELRAKEIAEIINANRKYSAQYHVDMLWHMSKTGYESGFHTSIGNSFYGDKLEPCYGIERLQVKTVYGMAPKALTKEQIKSKLMHDYTFAIEMAYRLDAANQRSALKMGYKTAYNNRVTGLILYNAGLGNWKNFHYNLGRYLRHGSKLEDLSVAVWRKYHFNFREIYSLNYYVNVLVESDILKKFVQDATLSAEPVVTEVATPATR
jgi:hypothetical protein